MRKIALPVIRTRRGKCAAATCTALISAAMYIIPQHVSLRDAALLPMTAIDLWIPFWPDSGVLYFAVFPLLLLTFIAIQDLTRATHFLYACLLAQTIGMTVFLLWPVRYPRALFPLPSAASTLGAALVNYCRSTDLPVNCLPSLHVSTVVLCIGALRGSRYSTLSILLGIALAASTLTFKQHYCADVLTGLLLGVFASAIFLRRNSRQLTERH